MKSTKTILVAVDLSKYSHVVVRQAKELAGEMGLPLVYVYVFEDISIIKEDFDVKKYQIVRDYDQQIRSEYVLDAGDKVFIKFGRAYEEIIKLAKGLSQPFIVAGHRGNNPILRFFTGSTAERLAQCSPFPVWIHKKQSVSMPKRILVASDLSATSSQTIAKANEFKSALHAKLEVLHVVPEPVPILDIEFYSQLYKNIKREDSRQLKIFKKKHPSLITVKAKGSIVGQIQARAKAFDVLAVSPHNRKASLAPMGSITAKLIRTGDTPLLILP